jgi:hypothetical protein
MCFDKYAMTIPKKIFDAFDQPKLFNTVDL